MLYERIAGLNYECIPLEWDTKYFGINCARVNLSGAVKESEKREILAFCSPYQFVTIANKYSNNQNNRWLGWVPGTFLADINVQFNMQLVNLQKVPDENILITNTYDGCDKILDIAEDAFQYSRFFHDPKLPVRQARSIYKYWTAEGFHQENKYFALYCKAKEPVGYVLFSFQKEEDYGCIELIAVERSQLGQGIGSALINATQIYLKEQAISRLQVGTQAENQAAMRLYNGCGFQYNYCTCIYHLWNQTSN